ncbi:MAG: tyrosine--tRNA ligase [Puniceicoccales bacterium]|nr:tyrosine--tRNA ligase [Puniceicoccales bacterium]
MGNDVMDLIFSGAQHSVGRDDIEKKLMAGKTLTIKLGVDPTRPDLTFGHMVVFRKLRQLQDLGHKAVFLIGDFTTTIGDPSGRSQTRPQLTEEQIKINGKTYLEQAFRILDPEKTAVRRNGEWFGKMTMADLLLMAREMTVAQLLEREDFNKRYKSSVPIAVVEFLYPLLQGYDSVALEADVELGGSDQLFNMLVGRDMQKNRGQAGQAVIAMPLLVGLDGVRKMSKSYDNYIAFNDTAPNMFGKVMSIGDGTMETYYRLLLGYGDGEIGEMLALHPMEAKKQLATKLTAIFYGKEVADGERKRFEAVFSGHEIPDEMDEIDLSQLETDPIDAVDAIHATCKFTSKNEIRRLIEQGAVKIDGQKIDIRRRIGSENSGSVLQIGRRYFFRIR